MQNHNKESINLILDFKKSVGLDILNDTDRNLLHYRNRSWTGVLSMVKLQNLFFKYLC